MTQENTEVIEAGELETVDVEATPVESVDEVGFADEPMAADAPGEDAQEAPEMVAGVNIQVFSDGNINLELPEGFEALTERDVEQMTKQVYENLYEQRIANTAIEMLRAKLQ